MRSKTTQRFRRALASAPSSVRRAARKAYSLFQRNPGHPSLNFKRLLSDPPLFSARITRNYRALAVKDGDTIVWFWIGSHAEYDQLILSFRG